MFNYILIDSLINLPHFSLNFSFSLSLSLYNNDWDICTIIRLFCYFARALAQIQFFYVFYNFILFDIVLNFLFVSRLSLSLQHAAYQSPTYPYAIKKTTYEKIKTEKKKNVH